MQLSPVNDSTITLAFFFLQLNYSPQCSSENYLQLRLNIRL